MENNEQRWTSNVCYSENIKFVVQMFIFLATDFVHTLTLVIKKVSPICNLPTVLQQYHHRAGMKMPVG